MFLRLAWLPWLTKIICNLIDQGLFVARVAIFYFPGVPFFISLQVVVVVNCLLLTIDSDFYAMASIACYTKYYYYFFINVCFSNPTRFEQTL